MPIPSQLDVAIEPSSSIHTGLPVKGYQAQSGDKVAKVNRNKVLEEKILRVLDELRNDPQVDQRWLAIGRTDFEKGLMAINRAIFKPNRIEGALDE